MLTHTVLFWLKPGLTTDQHTAFRAGLESLRKVNTIDSAYIGSPAGVPERPIIDRSYSFCLTIIFANVAAHNAYQVDPIHKAFVQNCQQYWTRVQIYDSE